MSNRRTQNSMTRKLLSQTKQCELCGSISGLEVHHIIPVSFGGPEEDADNMIVVCRKCHALLTPRSILTKRGIENVRPNPFARFYADYYRALNECDWDFDVYDALDIFDNLINKYSIKIYGKSAHNKEEQTA